MYGVHVVSGSNLWGASVSGSIVRGAWASWGAVGSPWRWCGGQTRGRVTCVVTVTCAVGACWQDVLIGRLASYNSSHSLPR